MLNVEEAGETWLQVITNNASCQSSYALKTGVVFFVENQVTFIIHISHLTEPSNSKCLILFNNSRIVHREKRILDDLATFTSLHIQCGSVHELFLFRKRQRLIRK